MDRRHPSPGTIVSFIGPGSIALLSRDSIWASSHSPKYWTIGAWTLIVLGLIQGVAGTLAALWLSPSPAPAPPS